MKTLDYLTLKCDNAAAVVENLQRLLADFQVHYTNLRNFHWNIKGHGFFILHAKFEELYNDSAAKIDEIAERILMLGGTPENRFSRYLETACVKETCGVKNGREAVEYILETYKHLIGEERRLIVVAEAADDVVTVDLLTGYIAQQEKLVWMLVAFSTQCCESK